MPILEYRCSNCQEIFEHLRLSRSDTRVECPHCGSHKAEQMFSVFATRSKAGDGPCFSREAGLCQAAGGALT
jgi:putative FmdB family regulatory protein